MRLGRHFGTTDDAGVKDTEGKLSFFRKWKEETHSNYDKLQEGVPRSTAPAASRIDVRQMFWLLRPRQWAKNVFVAAPLFFTPTAVSSYNIAIVCVGVVSFCLVASAAYVINDYFDRETDRQHPDKRMRPLASGTVAPFDAFVVAILLGGVGGVLATSLPAGFGMILAAYIVLNLAYSLWFKHIAILDVMMIAVGFVLRVEGGAKLIGVRPTVWIIVCTGLLALFLAIAKRHDDLVQGFDEAHRAALAGYNLRFLESAQSIVLGALLVSYTIYTTDAQVMARLGTDQLYLTVPFVVAGFLRYLQITLVENRSGSPTHIVTQDPFMLATIGGWILAFLALIHW